MSKNIHSGTPAQKKLLSDQSQDLMDLQDAIFTGWLGNSLPLGWDALEIHDPVAPHKTKVTMRLDDDMLKWFRKLGPGYQARINQVLRIYWRGLRMGLVQSHYSPEVYAKMLADRSRGR